jgi:hypothetical protein
VERISEEDLSQVCSRRRLPRPERREHYGDSPVERKQWSRLTVYHKLEDLYGEGQAYAACAHDGSSIG